MTYYKTWSVLFISLLLLTISSVDGMQTIPPAFWQTLKRLDQPLTSYVIIVTVDDQTLTLFKKSRLVTSYKISTSKYGLGELVGTEKTPLGLHRIAQKIGSNAATGTIFYYRENSGNKCKPNQKEYSQDDLVLTRILWLDGLEPGVNSGSNSQGQCIDSHDRYIYIHGTNHEKKLGTQSSHGCIRMSSKDVIDLYDKVPKGTLVWIVRSAAEF